MDSYVDGNMWRPIEFLGYSLGPSFSIVRFDATCSGLQHIAAKTLGILVNLVQPQDAPMLQLLIYNQVPWGLNKYLES